MVGRPVAHSSLPLVPAGAKPLPPQGGAWRHEPQTIIIDFHNSLRKETEIEIVVDRRHMPGPVTMMLPRLDRSDSSQALVGWRVTKRGALADEVAEHAASLLGRLGEAVEELGEKIELTARRMRHEPAVRDEREIKLGTLEGIDRSAVYVADQQVAAPAISGIRLARGAHIPPAIAVHARDGSKPGDQFRFDVLQRRKGKVVGGSTYVLSVFEHRG